jgi:Bacteriophage Sf6, terminase small subunit-like
VAGKDPEFAELYTAAREAQIGHLLGENVEIADTDPNVERARLWINATLAWIAKLHARKYLYRRHS